MKNQLNSLAFQLLFAAIMLSSCSVSDDEVTANDLNCISISTEYLGLWEDSETSFDEFTGELNSGRIVFDGVVIKDFNSPNYSKAKLVWVNNDPLKREIKFMEFIQKNSNSCSWLSMPERMLEYNSSKKWEKFRK